MDAQLQLPILIALGLAVGGIVLCIGFAFSGNSAQRFAQRVERQAARTRGEAQRVLSLRRHNEGGLDEFARRFLPRPDALRDRLTRTGKQIGLGAFGMASAGVGLAAMIGALFLGFRLLTALPIGIVLALWLPHLVVARMIGRRVFRFEALFPEAIGLIVRGLRSGLPPTESMQVVGREIGDPVGEEFRRISDQVKLGQPLEAALGEAAKRIGTPEFNFLVISMVVQRETGGNLAETLENLDQVLRRRRQMKLKIKAMSSEARASAMIIGALPFIMFTILFVVNPDYVMTLVNTHAGNMLLGAAFCSLGLGIGVMAKMIRFEI
jgi:tight adherence protein B